MFNWKSVLCRVEGITFLGRECQKMNACSEELPLSHSVSIFMRSSAMYLEYCFFTRSPKECWICHIWFLLFFPVYLELIAALLGNFQNPSKQFFQKYSAKDCLFSTLPQCAKSLWNIFSLLKFMKSNCTSCFGCLPVSSVPYWTLIYLFF